MAFFKNLSGQDYGVFSPLSNSPVDLGSRGNNSKSKSSLTQSGVFSPLSNPSFDLGNRGNDSKSKSPFIPAQGKYNFSSTPLTTGATASNGNASKALKISKSTQTGHDSTPSPAPKSQVVQNIQADFIRAVVEDCLDDFTLEWRNNFSSLYAKMIWQLMDSERRVENTIGMERMDYIRQLREDNDRLRAENERLKAMQFGKFFDQSK